MPRLPTKPGAELVKWWTKNSYETGRVTRHLSPMQQKPVEYLIKSAPEKAVRKVQENGLLLTSMGLFCWGIIAWGEQAHDNYHRAHWD